MAIGKLCPIDLRQLGDPITDGLDHARLNQAVADFLKDMRHLGIVAGGKQMRNGPIPVLMGEKVAAHLAMYLAREVRGFTQAVKQKVAEEMMVAVDTGAQLVHEQASRVQAGQYLQAILAVEQKIAHIAIQEGEHGGTLQKLLLGGFQLVQDFLSEVVKQVFEGGAAFFAENAPDAILRPDAQRLPDRLQADGPTLGAFMQLADIPLGQGYLVRFPEEAGGFLFREGEFVLPQLQHFPLEAPAVEGREA